MTSSAAAPPSRARSSGLLFVALSVSPEYLRGENARTDHQVRAGAAFSALVNTMVLALFALMPTTDLGTVGIILACIGLGTTAALIFALAREDKRIGRADLLMFLVLIVLYGLQLANALRLEHTPRNVGLVVHQCELAVVFSCSVSPDPGSSSAHASSAW